MKPLWGFFLLTFWFSLASLAETPARPVDSLVRNFKNSQDQLFQNDGEKREILAELYQINERMKVMSFHKSRLTDEMLGIEERIDDLKQNINSLDQITQLQRLMLKKRLRVLYKFSSNEGMMKALFSNHTSVDLDRFLKFLKIVSDRDYRLMRAYKINIFHYQKQLTRLTKEQIRLARVQKRIRTQEDQLALQHKKSQQFLAQIDATRLKETLRLHSLRNATEQAAHSNQVDAALLTLLQASFFEQKGRITPPVSGPVIQRFGYFTDPRYGIRFTHKGVFFRGTVGNPVLASFRGIVRYAGWLEGYGNTIILDHGHHYYTVYAYNSKLEIRSGDHVKMGQQIAQVGDSSPEFGPGLYFEIRHFSEPEDPLQWLSTDIQVSRIDNLER